MNQTHADIDLSQTVSLPLTLGHVLMTWQTLSEHFSNLRDYANLSEAQRRAVWALENELERCLVGQGVAALDGESQHCLMQAAAEHMVQVPVECLD